METPVLLNLLVSLILLVCAVTAKHLPPPPVTANHSSGEDYLSYGALNPHSVPCKIPGVPYSKCHPSASGNPYDRGCKNGTHCRYGQYEDSPPPSPSESPPPPPPESHPPPPPESPTPSTKPPSPSPEVKSSPPPPPSLESPPSPVSVQPPPSPLPPSHSSPSPPESLPTPPSPPPKSLSSPPSPVSVPPPPLFHPYLPSPSPPLFSVPLSPPTASGLPPPTVMSLGPPISGPGTLVTSPTTPSNSSSRSTLIVGISVTVVIVALSLFVLLIVFYIKKKRPQPHGESLEEEGEHPTEGLNSPLYHVVNVSSSSTTSGLLLTTSSDATGGSTSNDMQPQNTLTRSLRLSNRVSNCTVFTYEDLLEATDGFPDSKLIGEGGFGYVHKGVLPDGREVAVKQLKSDSGQGDLEFQAEVDIISRVHHKSLVSLVGYCIAGEKRLLVYDFVPNKTLDFHLHGNGQVSMNWTTRFKVSLSSAKGLAYLHEDCHPKIIHRDIKASNILLDFNFDAQVSDFGLAKFFSETNTHITTRVMGTFGYLAPEYASSGKLTEKSDVFSFGVLLLELITGLRPISKIPNSDDCIVDWARPLLAEALKKGKYDALVDQRLHDYDSKQMKRMIACAAASVRHLARLRPGMGQIVRVLEGGVSIDELNHGLQPGHSVVLEFHDKSISDKKKPTSHDFEGNDQKGSLGVSKIVTNFAMKLGLSCGR